MNIPGVALAIQAEALGGVVTAAELDDIGTELAQAPPVLRAVQGLEPASGKGVTGGHAVGEEFGEWEAGLEVGGVLSKLPGEFLGILVEEPIAIAAVLPLGEVLGADRFAGEIRGHDVLDFGKGVEPGHEVFALVAIVNAAIQLVADVAGEAGDFSGAGGVHTGRLRVES